MSSAAPSPTARRRRWWASWVLVTALAIAITAISVPPYLTGGANFPLDRTIVGYYTSLVLHSVPAGLTLLIGPLQFVPRLRARFPRAHRISGRVYLLSVVAASATSAYATVVTPSGFPLQVVFTMLIAAWLYTAFEAYRTIRRGDVRMHRVWTVRNYTLTFAAVTLRVYQLTGMALLPWVDYRDMYTTSAWAGLLGNVLIAEYFIVHRMLAPKTRESAPAPAPRQTAAIG
ncbi:DUF2306 domain-containing protein [Actinosynnema pretiosum]|uniref:DUF2306 domain-containing protein n=1 Tax=Actinosynnema pretiosum TaxID=42197 RepID=A0A290Z959_9PSEU|nr:DUF2306 domain-containing protein [Actinosynnema pretiosum]ATE55526.1 hypothetical protein CNX65_21410 [Actinosynnema pretiosum]